MQITQNSDVLNDIIDTLGLRGALYFRTDFSPPWAISVPDYERAARFHLVVQGRCFLQTPSRTAVELKAGDFIMIPAGRAHAICSDPEEEAAPLEDVIEKSGFNGRGVFKLGSHDPSASVQLVCGHFTFAANADHPLLRALPEFLLVTNSLRAQNPWLDEVLRLIVRQIFADPENSSATVTRLSEVIFIESLRACADQSDPLQRFLGALREKRIGNALLLMHNRLDEPWTLERIAAEVGMSRSKFAESFRERVGCSPMTYLADWRIQKAVNMLTSSRLSVQQVAARTGYQSAAAFTRAFSQKTGASPKNFRRQNAATA